MDQQFSHQTDPRKLSYVLVDRHRDLLLGKQLNPYAIEIQPTYTCNYRCTHCAYLNRNKKWQGKLSEYDVKGLKASVAKLGIKWVYISGAGEPLVLGYIRRCFTHFKEAGANVALLTNGSLLDQVDVEQLRALSYIQVSIPAITTELYQQITGQDRLDTILGIPELIDKKCGSLRPQLTGAFVVTQANAGTVEQAAKVILKSGYDAVKFRRAENYEANLPSSIWDLEHTNISKIFFKKSQCDVCLALELRLLATINPEGDVFHCLLDVGQPSLAIGNIHNDWLDVIWEKQHNDIVCKLQSRYKSGRCLAACRCHSYNDLFSTIHGYLPDWAADPYPAA